MTRNIKFTLSTTMLLCLSLFLGSIQAQTTTSKQQVIQVIIIDKETMTLAAYDKDGKELMKFPVATGLNYGTKQKKGDMKTPEGTFTISEINDASGWTHDFKDGKGVIKHAYGNHFVRLVTPGFTGIGIHGTHAPQSLGTRASEGCIRLENANLNKLVPLLTKKEKVVILPAKKDIFVDNGIQ